MNTREETMWGEGKLEYLNQEIQREFWKNKNAIRIRSYDEY